MALETITVQYDTTTHQIQVGTTLDLRDTACKERTIKTLLSAINTVVDFKASVIQPAASMPREIPSNGKQPIIRSAN